MGYKTIKNFSDFSLISEGAILMYMPGDNLKASKTMRVVDVERDFKKLLDAKKPFTVIVNTEGMKNVDHLKPEMDVIGQDGELVIVRDEKGGEHKIKAGKIDEIAVGNSVKDGIFLNTTYFVEGKERMRIKDYDGEKVKVMVHGDGIREYSIDEWKKLSKYDIR